MLEIPKDLQSYLEVESCKNFNEDRYYITEDIQELYNRIINNYNLARELRSYGFNYLNAALLFGLPGTGKAQPLYAKVLTPTGFTKMGDLNVGDLIIAGNGKVTTVDGIFPQGKKEIYEIELDDGSKTRCSIDHLWKVNDAANGDVPVVLPLSEMLDRIEDFSISYIPQIDFEKKPQHIDPYLFGMLLGDNALEKENLGEISKDVSNYLSILGIDENNQYIPVNYRYASYKQRYMLMQGLLDLNGTKEGDSILFKTSSERLARDVADLAHSLSGYARLKITGNTFTVQIHFCTADDRPFTRRIVSATYIGKEECQCIYIKDPSHLYITDDYIITHNTHFCRYVAYKQDIDFAYINFAKMMGGFGDANKIISDIFRFMANTKCVFMMDEIDCIARKRSKEGTDTAITLAGNTITVMQEMDYYRAHNVDSIILAATNREDTLDEALLSRFAIKHEMKPLDNIQKEQYLKNCLTDAEIPFDEAMIREYCAKNSRLEQRNMELDMIQGIANWIQGGKKEKVMISHIK